jgi:hypothetical protein
MRSIAALQQCIRWAGAGSRRAPLCFRHILPAGLSLDPVPPDALCRSLSSQPLGLSPATLAAATAPRISLLLTSLGGWLSGLVQRLQLPSCCAAPAELLRDGAAACRGAVAACCARLGSDASQLPPAADDEDR